MNNLQASTMGSKSEASTPSYWEKSNGFVRALMTSWMNYDGKRVHPMMVG